MKKESIWILLYFLETFYLFSRQFLFLYETIFLAQNKFPWNISLCSRTISLLTGTFLFLTQKMFVVCDIFLCSILWVKFFSLKSRNSINTTLIQKALELIKCNKKRRSSTSPQGSSLIASSYPGVLLIYLSLQLIPSLTMSS